MVTWSDPGLGVPTAHCGSALHVWAGLQAKHGHSAVSCDSVAAKLPDWGKCACVCVCVRHEWHATLLLIGMCGSSLQLLSLISLMKHVKTS